MIIDSTPSTMPTPTTTLPPASNYPDAANGQGRTKHHPETASRSPEWRLWLPCLPVACCHPQSDPPTIGAAHCAGAAARALPGMWRLPGQAGRAWGTRSWWTSPPWSALASPVGAAQRWQRSEGAAGGRGGRFGHLLPLRGVCALAPTSDVALLGCWRNGCVNKGCWWSMRLTPTLAHPLAQPRSRSHMLLVVAQSCCLTAAARAEGSMVPHGCPSTLPAASRRISVTNRASKSRRMST